MGFPLHEAEPPHGESPGPEQRPRIGNPADAAPGGGMPAGFYASLFLVMEEKSHGGKNTVFFGCSMMTLTNSFAS